MQRRVFLKTSAGLATLAIASGFGVTSRPAKSPPPGALKEVNPPPSPDPAHAVAVVGATLIDGLGGAPVADAAVVARGGTIEAAGPRDAVTLPGAAEVVEAQGQTVLPGLIDAHFHLGRGSGMYDLPGLFLSHGVTTVRDPGRPFEIYEPIRTAEAPMPRCFLTGGHLDASPPVWAHNAIVVEQAREARAVVHGLVDQGATAIKVYFGLPLELIRVVCETARQRDVPVTAHLELVDADDAIRAGLTGVEHVTSFGTALAAPEQAERFRTAVAADIEARYEGWYELWASLDLDRSPRVEPLLDLIRQQDVFVSPTLAHYEKRPGGQESSPMHVRGFQNMLEFVGRCHRAGVKLVVGSHTWSSEVALGWAYQQEMKLLVESGLAPMDAVEAGTMRNARFFRTDRRLGSVEPGKHADLLLVDGDPLEDIEAMRNVDRVMLNGKWLATRRE